MQLVREKHDSLGLQVRGWLEDAMQKPAKQTQLMVSASEKSTQMLLIGVNSFQQQLTRVIR